MLEREYLQKAQERNWDLEKVFERWVATKEKDRPPIFYAGESSYAVPRFSEEMKDVSLSTNSLISFSS